jgi:hypothetical protein
MLLFFSVLPVLGQYRQDSIGIAMGDIRTGEEKAAFKVDYTINPDIKALPVNVDGTKDEIAGGKDYTISKGENGKYTVIAGSMKTTVTTDVEKWLASKPIKKNIEFIEQGFTNRGLSSNSKSMFITNAEVHIYMPKENITDALNNKWLSKLNSINPKIKFEINTIENFIK